MQGYVQEYVYAYVYVSVRVCVEERDIARVKKMVKCSQKSTHGQFIWIFNWPGAGSKIKFWPNYWSICVYAHI